jgi:hypothetical protein
MVHGIDTDAINGCHVNRFARVMERAGLAIMGALCGFYVAALVAKADIVEVNSVGVLFLVILYGSVGFYLGVNIPPSPSGRSYRTVSDGALVPRTSPLALVSAAGTFLAAIAALLSVSMIVVDEMPPVIWIIGIGFWWTLGVLLQLAAGTVARLARFTGVAG